MNKAKYIVFLFESVLLILIRITYPKLNIISEFDVNYFLSEVVKAID